MKEMVKISVEAEILNGGLCYSIYEHALVLDQDNILVPVKRPVGRSDSFDRAVKHILDIGLAESLIVATSIDMVDT